MKDIINKNHEGDCIKIMGDFPKGKINLVLTDPPYNASNGGVNLPDNMTDILKNQIKTILFKTQDYAGTAGRNAK